MECKEQRMTKARLKKKNKAAGLITKLLQLR